MRLTLIENGRDPGIVQMMSAKPAKRPMPPAAADTGQPGLGVIYGQGQIMFRCFEKPSTLPRQHQLRDERGVIEPISILSVEQEGKSFVVTAVYLTA